MGISSRLFRKPPVLSRPSAGAAHQRDGWPFDQSGSTAAITTRQVLEGHEEIRAVVHYSDDHSWAFLCGTTDNKKDGRVISMDDAVRIDDSIRSIADLPPGWKAWRENRSAPWQRENDAASS